jgi:hypothetical protein
MSFTSSWGKENQKELQFQFNNMFDQMQLEEMIKGELNILTTMM